MSHSACTLSVPGARISYNLKGQGPLLLLIPGANGEGSIFTYLVAHLSARFTVCTYARRHYQPSSLTPQSSSSSASRLSLDVSDASALLAHLMASPDSSALVFGTSSGAIVALSLLQSHPKQVAKLIAHEPPLTALLGLEGEPVQEIFRSVWNRYKSDSWQAGVELFVSVLTTENTPERHIAATMGRDENETAVTTWLDGELLTYTKVEMDQTLLKNVTFTREDGERLVLVYGNETGNGFFEAVAQKLAKSVGARAVAVPGGHLGYVSRAEAFAAKLRELLSPEKEHL